MRTWKHPILIVAAAAVALAGCKGGPTGPGGANTGSQAPANLPREQSLYIAGFQWGPPANFNPFSTNAAWPVASEYLYETLMAYNMVSGKFEPLLAKSYQWTDPLTCRVTLQPGTKWQDGQPLTADDVLFTLELGKKFSVAFSPIWDYLAGVSKVDDRTIKLAMNPKKPHRAFVENALFTARIVPRHVWEKVAAAGKTLQAETNLKPVGSGPYKVMVASPERIVAERDDNYWGTKLYGTPAPKYLVHPIYKDNNAGNLALDRGDIDLSQEFCPEIWKMWEGKKPVGTWLKEPPYHLPGSIPMLIINIHKKGLDNPKIRRALAYAIDYPKIAELAMSRYSATAQSSLIIPAGVPESKYFSAEDVARYGWSYNPQKARDILERELGCKKGSDGIYSLPDGTRLGPWIVECPHGWTDWMTSLQVVARCAQDAGIDVKANFPEATVWTDDRDTGNFDLLMNGPAGGQGPAHPWLRFHDVMDDRGVAPMGKTAFWNVNRYKNPMVGPLLDRAAAAKSPQDVAAAYKELNRVFMGDIPAIPLEYRPWEFYEFNETHWKGFPTAKSGGCPQINNAGVRLLYKIKPANAQ